MKFLYLMKWKVSYFYSQRFIHFYNQFNNIFMNFSAYTHICETFIHIELSAAPSFVFYILIKSFTITLCISIQFHFIVISVNGITGTITIKRLS